AKARNAGDSAIDAALVMALQPVVHERDAVGVSTSGAARVFLVVEKVERTRYLVDGELVRTSKRPRARAPLLGGKRGAPRLVGRLRRLTPHRLIDLLLLLGRELLEKLRENAIEVDDGDRRDDVRADERGLPVRTLGNVRRALPLRRTEGRDEALRIGNGL